MVSECFGVAATLVWWFDVAGFRFAYLFLLFFILLFLYYYFVLYGLY